VIVAWNELMRRIGNVGILTGPPLFTAIAEYMNGMNELAVQGVDYPADIVGFLAGGSPIGGAVMYIFRFRCLYTSKLIIKTGEH